MNRTRKKKWSDLELTKIRPLTEWHEFNPVPPWTIEVAGSSHSFVYNLDQRIVCIFKLVPICDLNDDSHRVPAAQLYQDQGNLKKETDLRMCL